MSESESSLHLPTRAEIRAVIGPEVASDAQPDPATAPVENAVVPAAALVLGLAVAGWVGSELTLLRILRQPPPSELDDIPVDEALRSASAHASVAAASVLTLVPLGGFALATGLAVVGSCAQSDLVSIGLIALGLAAILAGLLVAAFLPSWLRPVQRRVDVRS